MKTVTFFTAVLFLASLRVWSEPAMSSDPNMAWTQLEQSAALPRTPTAWNTRQPSREEVEQYYKDMAGTARATADRATAFYTQFPESVHALDAKKLKCEMLKIAFLQGGRSQSDFDSWIQAQNALLSDPKLTDADRLETRVELAQANRVDPGADFKTRDAEYEKAVRQLMKDFPHTDRPYEMLLTLAAESSNDKARAIANEILGEPVSAAVKKEANAILRRLDGVGKPLDIQFTALDGREVDLSKMKGKVVLVDFWATWCGPCVGEIPHVKEAYEKFHSKGFEIVGISFDENKQALTHFVQSHGMPWPQYFDGKVWQNKFGQEFAIDSIPTMWLVDKSGNLQTESARDDLQGQVEKLLEQN